MKKEEIEKKQKEVEENFNEIVSKLQQLEKSYKQLNDVRIKLVGQYELLEQMKDAHKKEK